MSRSGPIVLLAVLWAEGTAPAGYAEEPPEAEAEAAPSYTTTVRTASPRRDPGATTVRAEEAARVPGAQGDALKGVEDLPGVGRSPPGAGQLVLWGAAPGDSRVLVDGVEIPALYHLGGWRAALGPALVRSIELVPGAFGPEYGRSLGGLVRVSARDPEVQGGHAVGGAFAADLLDAGGELSVAAGERFQLAVSGRYGYFERLVRAVLPGALGLFPIPRYADAQLRARLRLGEGEALRATFLYADDQLVRVPATAAMGSGAGTGAGAGDDPAGPTEVRREERARTFYRLALEYTRLLAGGGRVVVTAYGGLDVEHRQDLFGPTPARLDRDAWSYGLRIHYERRLHPRVFVLAGLDWRGERTRLGRVGSLTLPPREGDPYVFGQPPGSDVNADAWTTHIADVAPWVLGEFSLGPLKVSPGVRLDAYLIEGSRLVPRVGATPPIGYTRLAWALDPRVALSWRVHPVLTLQAAAGLYHQPPAPEDLSAVFGNPALGPTRAVHVSAAAALRVTVGAQARVGLVVEATGFYRHLDQQVVRSAAATPPLAGALGQDGSGRSYGLQLLVRAEPWRGLSGWLAYTVGRSERRDHPGEALRLADYDQTHLLTLVASYRRRGWGAGVRLRHATGLPRTPVVGAFFDAQGDQFQPLFGARNAIRLPDFVQLDLRVDRSFTFGRLLLEVYLDVQNVTYRRNAEEIVYRRDYRRAGYITGLPTLAVAGARLAF
ncbi:MAG TPA: TonB-dependent receptor [Polyangia bacterium]|jgi:hypothetical protein|nr:TonB-dependent receptor [Polyangia bacterium]